MHTSPPQQPHVLGATPAQALTQAAPGKGKQAAGTKAALRSTPALGRTPRMPGLEVSESTWAEWEAAAAARLY
ncbi:MAG: hypothetical protein ACOVLH_03345 [Roseateles sp.]|jgi:hypothetical protein